MFSVSLFLPLLEIFAPVLLGELVTAVVGVLNNQSISNITRLLAVFIGISLLKALFSSVQGYFGQLLDAKVCMNLRNMLMSKVISREYLIPSSLLSSAPVHLQSVSRFWSVIFWESLNGVVFLFGASMALVAVNWQLAIAAFIPIPFVAGVVIYLGPKFNNAMKRFYNGMDAAAQELLDAAESREFIQASNLEHVIQKQFQKANRSVERLSREFGWIISLYAPIFDLILAAATALLVLFFVHLVSSKDVSSPLFLTFFVYLSYFYRPIFGAAAINESWQKALVAYQYFYGLETLPPKSNQVAGRASIFPQEGIDRSMGEGVAIKFDKLCFAYPGQREIFSETEFSFVPRKIVGVMGENGSGKSTLVKLMMGILKPTSGAVILSNETSRFAYLPQSIYLNSGSVMDNILMVHPEFDPGMNSEKKQELVNFVYQVGERFGVAQKLQSVDLNLAHIGTATRSLSGGQKQLVGLWRFLIQAQYADYCILDEPDAFLDIEVLNKVVPNVLESVRNKTTIVISHNANLLERCDSIYWLGAGTLSLKSLK